MPVLHNMQFREIATKYGSWHAGLGFRLCSRCSRNVLWAAKKPAHRKFSPRIRVGLLELDDGRSLAESDAILFCLPEDTPPLPADRWGRAQALQWMFSEQDERALCRRRARLAQL